MLLSLLLSFAAQGATIVKWKDDATQPERLAALRGAEIVRDFGDLQMTVVRGGCAPLEAIGAIEYIEEDALIPLDGDPPNDPWWWHMYQSTTFELLGAVEAWDITKGSPAVRVGIVDTGCDATHFDMQGLVVTGYNVLDGSTDTTDYHGHGTMVSSVVAAQTNNGLGIAGMNWSASIVPVKVSNGLAELSAIIAGVKWCADHDIPIVNTSFAAWKYKSFQDAGKYLKQRNGLVFASAGNSGQYIPVSDTPYCIVVSGTELDDTLSTISNYGPAIDIGAPLCAIGAVPIAKAPGGFGAGCGTSFAAPRGAALAALLRSVYPTISAAELEDRIFASAVDLGPPGRDDQFGWGRIDVLAALSGAAPPGGDLEPPTVSIRSPSQGATVHKMLNVRVAASDNVGVVAVHLFIDGDLEAVTTSTPWSFKMKTAGWFQGPHDIECWAYDAAGNVGKSEVVTVIL